MQVNPMQFVQMIKQGQNPQQLMIQFLQSQVGGTPMGENLISLIKQGRTDDIEKIVRNLAQQKGIDFDKEFTTFRRQLGV